MKRTLMNAFSVGIIALGTAYLATPAQASEAGTAEYDACMRWCMQDYMFFTCHNTCKAYLGGGTEEPAEPETGIAN